MQTRKKPVYNYEQKLEYVKATTGAEALSGSTRTLFYRSAPFEFNKGADLCTFSEQELVDMLRKISGSKTGTRETTLSVVRRYIRWCVEAGKPGAVNNAENLMSFTLGSSTDLMIRNPEHLQAILDTALDPEQEETQDNAVRFFFWMAFGGMREELVPEITAEDIDLGNMEVVKNGDIAVIYRQALPCIRNCIQLTKFQYKNKAYVNAGTIARNRVAGDKVTRGIRGVPTTLNLRAQVTKRFSAAAEEHPEINRMTYGNVWTAGTFYRLYEKEQAGIEPNFTAIIMAGLPENRIEDREGRNALKVYVSAAERKMRLDYGRWKNNLI